MLDRRQLRILGMILLLAVFATGVWQLADRRGGNDRPGGVPAIAVQQQKLKGAPPPLARVHAQAGELLDTDIAGALRALRGTPVVINAWASWCGPCRAEMPIVARVALREGRTIAFLGLNTRDRDRQGAAAMIARSPPSYPSFRDPSGARATRLGFGSALPAMLFLRPDGRVAYLHQGAYAGEADLERDIRRYLP